MRPEKEASWHPTQNRFQDFLKEYLTFLEHHRGLREATLYFHRRWGERFLHHLAEHLPGRDLARLIIPIVDAFVLPLGCSVGRDTQWQIIQAVRGVLRHLHRTGRVAEDWSRFVHGPRRYRLASIPTTISVDEVHRLLTTIDRRSAIAVVITRSASLCMAFALERSLILA